MYLPNKDRLSKLGLPTLVFRRLLGDIVEVFKILSGIYDNTVPSFDPCRLHSPQPPEVTIKNCLKLSVTKMYDRSISLYV